VALLRKRTCKLQVFATLYVWRDSCMCFLHLRSSNLSHKKHFNVCPYVWCDSFVCVTWLIHMCDMTHSCDLYIWGAANCRVRSASMYVHTCDVTRSYMWWLIHTCDMTHSRVVYIYGAASCRVRSASLYVHACDVTRPFVWRDSFTRVTWLIHTFFMSTERQVVA